MDKMRTLIVEKDGTNFTIDMTNASSAVVYSLDKEEQEKYLSIAYKDVKNAFIYYSEHTEPSRPLKKAFMTIPTPYSFSAIHGITTSSKCQRVMVLPLSSVVS